MITEDDDAATAPCVEARGLLVPRKEASGPTKLMAKLHVGPSSTTACTLVALLLLYNARFEEKLAPFGQTCSGAPWLPPVKNCVLSVVFLYVPRLYCSCHCDPRQSP